MILDPHLELRLLKDAQYQPVMRPTQWIVHTAVDAPGPTNLGLYFDRAGIELESHTWLRFGGRHEQLVPFNRSADANYLANRRPDGTGAISTETEDDGSPVENPWDKAQVAELIRFGTMLHIEFDIPVRLPAAHNLPGMGYHCLFPQHWTNVRGKTCPGKTRIDQFLDVVLPGIRVAVSASNPPKDDDDMAAGSLIQVPGAPEWWLSDGFKRRHIASKAEAGQLAYAGIARWNNGKPFPVTAEVLKRLPIDKTT